MELQFHPGPARKLSTTLRCVIPVVCVARWEGEGSSKQHN